MAALCRALQGKEEEAQGAAGRGVCRAGGLALTRNPLILFTQPS